MFKFTVQKVSVSEMWCLTVRVCEENVVAFDDHLTAVARLSAKKIIKCWEVTNIGVALSAVWRLTLDRERDRDLDRRLLSRLERWSRDDRLCRSRERDLRLRFDRDDLDL